MRAFCLPILLTTLATSISASPGYGYFTLSRFFLQIVPQYQGHAIAYFNITAYDSSTPQQERFDTYSFVADINGPFGCGAGDFPTLKYTGGSYAPFINISFSGSGSGGNFAYQLNFTRTTDKTHGTLYLTEGDVQLAPKITYGQPCWTIDHNHGEIDIPYQAPGT